MNLVFKHVSFPSEAINSLTFECLSNGPFVGDGAQFIFQIGLEDGRFFQITPDHVVESGKANPYYRDNDSAWKFLHEMANAIAYKECRWYTSEAAKELSQRLGIPVLSRF